MTEEAGREVEVVEGLTKRKQIDADEVVSLSELSSAPYHERRDHRITSAALVVILASAGVSCLALIIPVIFPSCAAESRCAGVPAADWPLEMLRLSLVASLAFVMGNNGKQG